MNNGVLGYPDTPAPAGQVPATALFANLDSYAPASGGVVHFAKTRFGGAQLVRGARFYAPSTDGSGKYAALLYSNVVLAGVDRPAILKAATNARVPAAGDNYWDFRHVVRFEPGDWFAMWMESQGPHCAFATVVDNSGLYLGSLSTYGDIPAVVRTPVSLSADSKMVVISGIPA